MAEERALATAGRRGEPIPEFPADGRTVAAALACRAAVVPETPSSPAKNRPNPGQKARNSSKWPSGEILAELRENQRNGHRGKFWPNDRKISEMAKKWAKSWPNCGKINEMAKKWAKFWPNCGKISEMAKKWAKSWPNCGKFNEMAKKWAKSWPNCGKFIEMAKNQPNPGRMTEKSAKWPRIGGNPGRIAGKSVKWPRISQILAKRQEIHRNGQESAKSWPNDRNFNNQKKKY